MAIETLGSMSNILKTGDTKTWTKSADLKLKDPFTLDDATKLNPSNDVSFNEMLLDSIMDVNKLQKDANLAIQKLATGKTKNIHETLLAVEKADIAFRAMNQVRIKVIDAYKEIMRMQM
ncbi:MAG: flagellar hook-basal body complex protein FliE [Bacteriovoracaceae bacterium]|nr:flagellar hook-basal body complex protein FliE [Bacteriovoracaceae bacterium]